MWITVHTLPPGGKTTTFKLTCFATEESLESCLAAGSIVRHSHTAICVGTIIKAIKRAQYSSNVKNKAMEKNERHAFEKKVEPFQKKYLSPFSTQFKKKVEIGTQNLPRISSSAWGEDDTFSMCWRHAINISLQKKKSLN